MEYEELICETIVEYGWGEAGNCLEPPVYRVWTKHDQSDSRLVCEKHFQELLRKSNITNVETVTNAA